MMNLSYEETQKLKYLSTLFTACSVEELKERAESEEIVKKLQGTKLESDDLFIQLVNQHNTTQVDIARLISEVAILKSDFTNLIRAVNRGYQHATPNELETLKLKYSAY